MCGFGIGEEMPVGPSRPHIHRDYRDAAGHAGPVPRHMLGSQHRTKRTGQGCFKESDREGEERLRRKEHVQVGAGQGDIEIPLQM